MVDQGTPVRQSLRFFFLTREGYNVSPFADVKKGITLYFVIFTTRRVGPAGNRTRCYSDMGIPNPKTLVIWASFSHITSAIWVRVRVRVTGDAYITRVLGMGMLKTRGCPYHFDTGPTTQRSGTQAIAYFTVTGGNEAEADLVLIQPFLLSYVNHVVLLLNSIVKA